MIAGDHRAALPRRLAVPAACAALALAVTLPLLGRGFVLSYDMIFTPRQPLSPATVGLGPALPRAVPADAVIALVTHVLPGDLIQQAILLLVFFAAALGAARLVPTGSKTIQLVAAVIYGWNAYLAERLFLGHWALLVAYAALPWVVGAALAVRQGKPGGWSRLVLCGLPAVLVPTGGILAAGAAIVAAGRRHVLGTVGIAFVLNAPWWLPSVSHPSGAYSDPAAVPIFAARGEGWAHPVLSVLGLGGIWNAEVVPPSRDSPLTPVITVLLVTAALWGCRELAQRWGVAARGLVLLATGGLVLAVAGSVPLLDDALGWAVAHLPGAGLLRDGQKWAAWWALLLAVGAALAIQRLATRVPARLGRRALLVGGVLLPLAVLPDLAWGGAGRLQRVQYPPDWSAVADILARDNRHGDVLALPFATYRGFAWNADRTQLDPAPRFLPKTTIADDELLVDQAVIRGEDPRVDRIRTALRTREPLAPLGIGWVLVEHGMPGAVPAYVVAGLRPSYQGSWLTLYRLPEPIAAPPVHGPPVLPVLLADALALALGCSALLWRMLLMGRVEKTSRSIGPAGRWSA